MKSASLNHIYRLVWNELSNTYVAVAEHTSGRGKRTSGVTGMAGVLAAAALLAGSGAALAQALPTGGSVVAGAATLSQAGNQLTVTQATQRVVTNWNTFDVGAGATVRFDQPNAGSIALNRVTGGGAASSILGTLNANGNVWLLNPGGVVIGKGAQVNVGGLVASSLGISDADFMAGGSRFGGGSGAGAVINQGSIRTGNGGVVVLMAPRVSNTGSISTPGGSTALAAGETVSVDFKGDGLISVAVERGALDAAAENSGSISAAGGLVALTARGADALIGSVVNNTGVIEARGLVARNGRILLDGDVAGGSTHVSGTLDASSADGKGGAIVVTGKTIALDNGAALDASGTTGGGTINVGGGWQGKDGGIANATTVTADASVTARADATGNGDGGKVVFWSDDATRFAGSIGVRGGADGGNGGTAEVSGKQTLVYDGHTDARASKGTTGDLLLDPTTITVSGGAGVSGDWSTGSGAVTVYEQTLESQTANVLMQATGNINFQNLALNGGDGKISMANNVSLRVEGGTGGQGNITFANTANTIEVFGTGSLMFVAGKTGTGNLVDMPNLIAHGAGTNPSSSLPSHDVTVVGSGTPGAGSITLYGADGVTVGGSVTTNGGYVRVWADSDNAGGGGYTMSAPVFTNGGNFYVSAGSGAILLNSNMTLGTGRITFRADGSYTNGARTLGGVLSVNGPVTIDSPFTMNAGSGIYTDGAITFTSSVNLNTGAGALTLRASDIDFSNASVTNVSTASVNLQPYDIATNIALNGGATGIARASTFTKLAGIKNLTIGRADGTGITNVPSGGFAFDASETLKLLNGSMQIDGELRNTSTAAGSRVVAQAGQDVSIASTGSVVSGGTNASAIVLSAGGNFVNSNPNASVLTTGAGGKWLIYSTTAPSDTVGALVNDFKQYNARYLGGTAADTVRGTGNGFLYTEAPVVNVTLVNPVVKTYDGTSAATLVTSNFSETGSVHGDSVTFRVGANGAAQYDSKNVGTTKQVSVAGIDVDTATNGGVAVYGYRFNAVASANIGEVDKRVLQLQQGSVSASAADKVYDGGTGATVTGVTFTNVATGDQLSGTGTGSFADKNAAAGKVVSVSNIAIGGLDAGNYDLGSITSTTALASITPKALTATATVADRVYDGSRSAQISNIALNGVVQNDVVSDGAGSVGTFDTKNAGTGKTVTGGAIVLTGADAANYVMDGTASIGTATITPRTVTATANVTGKVYDGTTVATIGNVAFNGVLGGDTLTSASGSTGTFDTKNVGAGKNVSGAGIVLAGADAGNYVVDTTTSIGTAAITPKTISGSATGVDKVYDGTTAASLTGVQLVGVVAGDQNDVLAVGTSGSFDDKNAGGAKTIRGSGISLAGSGAGNYAFDTAAPVATAAITPKTITATADVAGKVYDGNTVASISNIAFGGVVAGDSLTSGAGSTGAFDSKNAGAGKRVTGGAIVLAGADAGNYLVDATAAIGTAAITPKTITATADVAGKVYDGSTVASISNIALSGVLAGDSLNGAAGSVGRFDTKNVGTAKNVTGAGIVLAGTDAGNYVVDTASTIGTAAITPKTITVTADVASKVYDGTTAASFDNVAFNGVVAGDSLASGAGSVGTFDSKNVGAGKRVTGSGIVLTGADAGNYAIDAGAFVGTGRITPKTITATADVAGKVYDGNTIATIGNIAFGGVVAGDSLNGGAGSVGRFDGKNVGAGKRVTGGDIVLAGADAGNYVVDATTPIGRADITPKTLVVGEARVQPKVYDGTTVATVSELALGGIVAGDRVKGVGGSGRFDSSTVGDGKTVTVSGLALTGEDAGNYTFDRAATTGQASIVAQQTVGTPVALIAASSGANATSASAGRDGSASVAASATQGSAVQAATQTASLVTVANVSAPSGGATGGQQASQNAGTTVRPLVLADAVLTGNGRLSLAIDDGVASAPVHSTVAVFSTRTTQGALQPEGQYEVSDRGNAIALVSSGTATRTPPQVQAQQSGAQTATGSIAMNDGVVMELRVTLQSDGVLVVQVPPSGTGTDSEAITAYAMTVAKKRFEIPAETVKAVVVQYASRSAEGDTGTATKVAGL
jgi:filamentous hemagglutinin family protein